MAATELQEQLQTALGASYVLEREVARGKLATVYLAREAKSRRPVGLRILNPELVESVGLERLRREILLASKLRHPHIVPLLGFGETFGGQVWFAMPWTDSESLRDRLKRGGQLPVDDGLRIAREVASALEYAHGQGAVHCDITPQNILLEGGAARIANFGIARALASAAGAPSRRAVLIEAGLATGMPAYISPEQIKGERAADGRSDIYSLACVLYEMLAGTPPFTGPTPQAILAKRRSAQVPSVWAVRPTVPGVVTAAIERALALEPAARFQTAAEFAAALDTSSGGRRMSWPKVPRVAWIPALGLLVVSAAAVLWQARVETVAEGGGVAGRIRLAVLPFDNIGDSADGYFAAGFAEAVRNRLAAVSGLEVIATPSSDDYRGTTETPQRIGQQLGVRYVLAGKLQWTKAPGGPSRIQVTPRLIDARTATTRWTAQFDVPLAEIFSLQSDVASQIAQRLQIDLTPAGRSALADPPAGTFEAYDAYLRGRDVERDNSDSATAGLAVSAYERAVRRDPTFALAWAALSEAHSRIYSAGLATTAEDEAAQSAADRAAALAPNSARAHAAVALYQFAIRHDNARSYAECQAGLRLQPTDAELLGQAAELDARLGHWVEGLDYGQQRVRMDPRSSLARIGLGETQLRLHRYADARTTLDRAIALDPGSMEAVELRAIVELAQGDLPAARAVLRAAAPAIDSSVFVAHLTNKLDLGWILDSAQARILLGLGSSAYDNSVVRWGLAQADAHAQAGDTARARAYADTVRARAEVLLTYAPNDPELHTSRGLALAYLARKDDAVVEGERAVALDPVASDGLGGPFYQYQLARIYVMVNEPDRAVATLESLHAASYYVTPAWLRVDPHFAPVRSKVSR